MATSTRLFLSIIAVLVVCVFVFYATGPQQPPSPVVTEPIDATEAPAAKPVETRNESARQRVRETPVRESASASRPPVTPPTLSAEVLKPTEQPTSPPRAEASSTRNTGGGVLSESVRRLMDPGRPPQTASTEPASPTHSDDDSTGASPGVSEAPDNATTSGRSPESDQEASIRPDAGHNPPQAPVDGPSDDAAGRPPEEEQAATASTERRPASAPPRFTEYEVQAGDNMSLIAAAWFGDPNKWDLIAKANPLIDPRAMRVGMTLRLPPKDAVRVPSGPEQEDGRIVYTVRSGDTLSSIAASYYGDGRFWRELFDANRQLLEGNADRLDVGMKLLIPPAPEGAPRKPD